jgi:hypothetical protein
MRLQTLQCPQYEAAMLSNNLVSLYRRYSRLFRLYPLAEFSAVVLRFADLAKGFALRFSDHKSFPALPNGLGGALVSLPLCLGMMFSPLVNV